MESLQEVLTGAKSAAIGGHVHPDGDCAGSCLAVYNYIRENFPQMTVDLYLDPIPDEFRFLKHAEDIKTADADVPVYDVFLALDCGDAMRLGKAERYFHAAKKTVCVDHHKSNLSFAQENYIFPHASSTSELVYELMEESLISKAVAECIYLGIVHDTGVFQYSSTTSQTMQVAGRLMDKGIDHSRIIGDTFFAKSYVQTRILGVALAKSRLYFDGQCIVSILSQNEMKEVGADTKDLDAIVSQMRAVKGVEAAVFIYENEDGTFKASLRSEDRVDVSEIAVKFGGGGHAKAAGATMNGTAEEIQDQLLTEIRRQLEDENNV